MPGKLQLHPMSNRSFFQPKKSKKSYSGVYVNIITDLYKNNQQKNGLKNKINQIKNTKLSITQIERFSLIHYRSKYQRILPIHRQEILLMEQILISVYFHLSLHLYR